jgi:predicted flap endonuclease-1-like 5' DNA nuclease
MDNLKELKQLTTQIDRLKVKSLEYLKRNIRAQGKRQEINDRVEELFDRIKSLLEGKPSDFEAEIDRVASRLRVTPGVRWRALRWRMGKLTTARRARARARGLTRIEGIGSLFAQRLQEAGVTSTQKLLSLGASPRGRRQLAEDIGTSERMILDWVTSADLMRIKGVGEEYTYLLDEAGVDTVPELAQRNPANLYQRLVAVNARKRLVRRLPSEAEVEDWVAQAKKLPRLIRY